MKKIKKAAKKVIENTGYKVSKINQGPINPQHERNIAPEVFFDIYFKTAPKDNFYFVQIGANDGKSGDFLNKYITKYNLQGTLVEPQPDVFSRLKNNYSNQKGLSFVNAAIGDGAEDMTFYTVKKDLHTEENYFDVTAISSFDRETFRKTVMKRVPDRIEYISDDIEDYVEEIQIKTVSLPELIKENDINHIDYLNIDCEGYDHQIIKMIDFDVIKPQIINFESKWLDDVDRQSVESLLERNGYTIFRHGNDTCAYLA